MGTFADRAQGAFLGLALGDAYGRPLEFISDQRVRTTAISLQSGEFRWTDDTHMACYLARAILDLPPGPFDGEALGQAVGQRFVEWLHDPLTPSTAPGNACLRGVRAYERTHNWRTSGNPPSDGCGAVMRICPLALAYWGPALTDAAEISARITHTHANALEAAIAAAHLLRWTLEEGRWAEHLVEAASRQLRGPWHRGGIVADALQAAIAFSHRPEADHVWLDEPGIPDGGGGWRSASALGLAVAAALTWGGNFATAVEKGARIFGDSDSVACLVGMFMGGAGGTAVLPTPWLEVLPDRQIITDLATALAARGAVSPRHPGGVS